jgi:ligand-binding sensor domain-containing protein/signal transduction histidine kinase
VTRSRGFALASLTALGHLAWPEPARALDPAKAPTQYGHDVWQIEEGLPTGTVRAIEQTRDGYLWLGTYEGLARFDGVRFTVFDKANTPELKSDNITALHEDQTGTLWIGTSGGGLVRHRAGRFTRYGTTTNELSRRIVDVAEDQEGNVWVAVQPHDVFQLRDRTMVAPPALAASPVQFVTALHVAPDGGLWIGSRTQGIVVLKDGALRSYTVADGLPSNEVHALAAGPEGAPWVGSARGVSRLAKDGSFTTPLSEDHVRALLPDRDGNLWIGSSEGGLMRLRDGQVHRFPRAQVPPGILVHDLHEDREGSLWVGFRDGGLHRFRDGAFTAIGEPEGLSTDLVTTLHAAADGSVWVGTSGGGLNRIRNGRITVIRAKDGLSQDSISSVTSDAEGTLWVGATNSGLNRLRDGKITVFQPSDGLSHDNVFALLPGREGGLWVGTRGGGLTHFVGSKFVTYGTQQGLSPFVWDLLQDRAGTLWIGSSYGVATLDRGVVRYVSPPRVRFQTLHIDSDGVVWAGGPEGLYRWKDGKGFAFTTREGLVNDHVGQILEDGRQNLWLGTNRGISRIRKKQLTDVAEGRIRRVTPVTYDTSDGMRSRECNYGDGCKTGDGRLWFPTIRGAVVVDPERVRSNPLPPPVVVERVVADGRELTAEAGAAQVPPGEGRLEVQFTALSFLAPSKVRFSHRLEGFDRAWSEPGSRREAIYTNLPPGAYTFRVKACNNDGVWNEAGASFPLYLRPHFYQTGWFYALCAALLAGAAWRIHWLRVQRFVEMERVRTRIAADLHDDIGAGLSLIAVQSELARQQFLHDGTRALDILGRIAGTAGNLVDSMSDIVWAVNPRRDRMQDLVHRMRSFANDVEDARGVRVGLRAEVLNPGQRLEPDFRRHVYLIFKEAVSNAVRHSGCARVDVALDVGHGQVFLRVQDDGRGFDPSQGGDGHGLHTMAQRASDLGGTAKIVSRPGEGTAVSVRVSLAGSGSERWWGPRKRGARAKGSRGR